MSTDTGLSAVIVELMGASVELRCKYDELRAENTRLHEALDAAEWALADIVSYRTEDQIMRDKLAGIAETALTKIRETRRDRVRLPKHQKSDLHKPVSNPAPRTKFPPPRGRNSPPSAGEEPKP